MATATPPAPRAVTAPPARRTCAPSPSALEPKGVGVVVEAEHLCMSLRGVRAAGVRAVTSTLGGALRDDPRSRQEFLARTGAAR